MEGRICLMPANTLRKVSKETVSAPQVTDMASIQSPDQPLRVHDVTD